MAVEVVGRLMHEAVGNKRLDAETMKRGKAAVRRHLVKRDRGEADPDAAASTELPRKVPRKAQVGVGDMVAALREEQRLADIEKLIKKKIELEPFAFPENEPHGRFNQGRRLYEHEDGRPPRARDDQRSNSGSARRPAAAPRDPFFDQPYEAAAPGDTAVAPSWEASARGAARSPVSANIKPKRKLAALFKPEVPSSS